MKTRISTVFALSILFAACPPGVARAESLTTTYDAAGIGDEGMMFDVVATKALQITGLQFAFEDLPLTDSVEIFTKSGSYVGSETVPANWTLSGAGSVTVSALDEPSPILFLSTPIVLPAGGQIGIYVLRDSGSGPNVATTAGTQSGTVAAIDSNLIIFEGIDVNGSFASIGESNRIPNVTVHYTLVDADAPVVKPIGKRRIRTTETRHAIFGIATDDVGIATVRARFKRLRANGTTRTVSRNLDVDSDGLFRISVKTFIGRNPVRFRATDTAGNFSATARVVVTGES